MPLLLWLLGGCASPPVARTTVDLREGFEVTGRFAVRYGKEGASGRINWVHSRTADDVVISSALGQGIASITRTAGNAVLQTGDDRHFHGEDVESVTQQALGWRLPLAGMVDWIQGRESALRQADNIERDSQARLQVLVQDGWRMEFGEYEGSRPMRLRLAKEDIEIRLAIEHWSSAP